MGGGGGGGRIKNCEHAMLICLFTQAELTFSCRFPIWLHLVLILMISRKASLALADIHSLQQDRDRYYYYLHFQFLSYQRQLSQKIMCDV